jgi:hypothetical protein
VGGGPRTRKSAVMVCAVHVFMSLGFRAVLTCLSWLVRSVYTDSMGRGAASDVINRERVLLLSPENHPVTPADVCVL